MDQKLYIYTLSAKPCGFEKKEFFKYNVDALTVIYLQNLFTYKFTIY